MARSSDGESGLPGLCLSCRGRFNQYAVVRVADEIVIDLMTSASGIPYAEAALDMQTRHIEGVPIPFASPALLWKMKGGSLRDKDQPDIHFLRQLLEST